MSQPQDGAIVYDPRGVVDTQPVALAKRLTNLGGRRLAVLDNAKWNAGALLRRTAARLAEETDFAALNHYRKQSFSAVAAPELIEEIAADNDIVLTAIGD